MKMTQGAGTISNYTSYTNNCVRNQMPYKIPMPSLSAVQLYIDIGAVQPSAVQYQLIHTCGSLGGTIEILTTSTYVIGQDSNDNWYGVFKNLTGVSGGLNCFVIAITLTISAVDTIYFSDEYCISDSCDSITLIKGCYGNLDSKISYNKQGIFFGTSETGVGDLTVKYEHQLYLRDVELEYSAFKLTFKQGRTRNFRTEETDLLQFFSEFIPAWYAPDVIAVFARGEVYIDSTKYLVNEVDFTKIEDCKRMWKPSATLKESYYQSFSCELDPCAAPAEECCEPTGITAEVEFDSGGVTCCDPEIVNADVEFESGA